MKNNHFYADDQEEEPLKAPLQVKSNVHIEAQKGLSGFNSLLNTITQVMTILLTMYFIFLIFNLITCRNGTKGNSLLLDDETVKIIDIGHKDSATNDRRTLTDDKDYEKELNSNVDEKWWLNDDLFDDKRIVATKDASSDKKEEVQHDKPDSSVQMIPSHKSQSSDLHQKFDKKGQQKTSKFMRTQISDNILQASPKAVKESDHSKQNKMKLDETKKEEEAIQDQKQQQLSNKAKATTSQQKLVNLLSYKERESVIQNYIDEVDDKKSIFLENANHNNEIKDQKSKLDRKIEKILTKKYGLDNYHAANSFCVILSTFNNAQTNQIKRTLNSIFNQDYEKYHVVVMDMQSTDGTTDKVSNFIKNNPKIADKLKFVKSQNRVSIAASFEGLKHCQKDEIVILMNGDSQLLSRQVFKLTDQSYQSEKASVVYADSYILDVAKKQVKPTRNSAYDESEKFMNLYRDTERKYGDFFTFNVNLAASIEQELLKNAFNEYFKLTGNEALIVPLLELSCGKIAQLNQPLLFVQVDSNTVKREETASDEERKAISREKKLDKC